jgi:hypothetical protein
MSEILDINQLEEGFHQLQEHSDSQFGEIQKLKETIARLETENKSLKLMIDTNLPQVGSQFVDLSLGISNQQLICEVQLTMLKDRAVTQELTIEEVKKVQILTDVLAKCKQGKTPNEISVSRMTDEELLKAATIDVSN